MFNFDPATIISRILTLLIAFTVHEFAHAWTATAFGDETAKLNGRLTLNPIAHLDFLGTLLLIVAGFGWAKPVPINPYVLQRRSRAAVMWVSLAGPFSNFLMAALAAIPFRLNLLSIYDLSSNTILPSLSYFFFIFIYINLTLLLFNLIPFAPLDGEKVLDYFLPPNLARSWEAIRPYGPMLLLVVVFLLPTLGINLLGMIINPPINALWHLLIGV
jgi:Zn-dependent protease